MSRDLRLLQDWGRATQPTPAHVREVADRLQDRGCFGSPAEASLHGLPAPTPHDLTRTRGGLARRLADLPLARTRPLRAGRRVAAIAAVAAVVAVIVLPRPDRVLSERLESPADWQERAPTSEVALRFQGSGSLSGTAHSPEITWETGRLEVSVLPEHDVHLVVETREARVIVTGTAFVVERSVAQGSVVSVSQGTVEVVCRDEGLTSVGAGSRKDCPPVSAYGWLARALLLQDRHAAAGEVLASAETGLKRPDARGAVAEELGAIRILALADLGRDTEALAAAEAYLGRGHTTREDEVRRTAVRLARVVGGCARARPHLEVLAATDPEAASLLAACTRGDLP